MNNLQGELFIYQQKAYSSSNLVGNIMKNIVTRSKE